MDSVNTTRDHLLVLCIGSLESIESLQERFHISAYSLSDLKQELYRLLRSDSLTVLEKSHVIGSRPCVSDVWTRDTNPEEARTVLSWVFSVTKRWNQLLQEIAVGVYQPIADFTMQLPGISTACTFLYSVLQFFQDALTHTKTKTKHRNAIPADSMTAVVLQYREKECAIPWISNQRIQRVMHFPIPLRPFEATVRLYSSKAQCEATYSSTPRSVPISPVSRNRVQMAFHNYSDDVLYQARDQLRKERIKKVTGVQNTLIPRFNIHDCGEELYLTCGRHCVFKVGQGMYRSVRATVSIPRNQYTYFEMHLSPTLDTRRESFSHKKLPNVNVCIGLSTRFMPLHSLVGTGNYSIGYYSTGHILTGKKRKRMEAAHIGYGLFSTIGVLVHVSDTQSVRVRFSISGYPVRNACNRVIESTFHLPKDTELFPTVSLHSQNVSVHTRYTTEDTVSFPNFELQEPVPIYCLDGLQLV